MERKGKRSKRHFVFKVTKDLQSVKDKIQKEF